MFGSTRTGDYVVICSGKPHFAKERRKVTHIDANRRLLEVGGDFFDITTGFLKTPGHFGCGETARRVHLPEGEQLTLAIRGELIKKIITLHVKHLKKVSNEDLFEAARLLGITLQL